MARRLRHGWRAGLVLVLALVPRVAVADAPETLGSAQALFDAAAIDLERGDLAAACPKLAEVVRLVPEGLGAKLRLADCYERQGRTASAWATYVRARNDALKANQAARVALASERIAALEPRLVRLTIRVSDAAAAASELRVERGGRPIERPEWNLPVPVDPGAERVSAAAPGRETWAATVEVRDADVTVEVPVLAEAKALAAGSTAARSRAIDASARPPPSETEDGVPTWVVGVGVGGVVATAVSVGFLIDQMNVQADIDEACTPECRAGFDAVSANDRLLRDFGLFVGFGAAGVLALGAASWGLLTHDGRPAARATYLRPGIGGVSVGGAF